MHSLLRISCDSKYDFGFKTQNIINRKFRVPRKQGAHFLGSRAQIQDSWVFSSSA
jgi:hypothetical protein